MYLSKITFEEQKKYEQNGKLLFEHVILLSHLWMNKLTQTHA